jgi:hypothetical protein
VKRTELRRTGFKRAPVMTPTRRTSLSPRSKKRAAQERTYSKRRRLFLEAWPTCQHPDVCGSPATDVHHMAGRDGDRLLDESRWIALCRPHHEHVTAHPALAIAQGVSYPRIGVAS